MFDHRPQVELHGEALSSLDSAMRRPVAILFLAVSLACGRSAPSGTDGAPRPLAVATVRELGAVSRPATVVGRDGGPTALVGGRVLWTFGDTFYRTRAVDGTTFRSNTAALADPARPLEAAEPIDANGTPLAALPFTAEEQAYNDSTGRPDNRIALWIASLAPEPDGNALAFYSKLYVRPGVLNYEDIGGGVARFRPGRTVGERLAGLVFQAPEPMFVHGAVVDGGSLYLMGKLPGRDQPYGVARVPQAQVADRAAYRFWNGREWTGDVRAAAGVVSGIPGALSVAYNPYLGAFLAVHSAPLSNDVVGRTAPRPEGPWSAPVTLFTGLPPLARGEFNVDYAGFEHPELAQDGGRRLFVSYHRPLAGFLEGEVRLVEVMLR
jgi:hypothetical protein